MPRAKTASSPSIEVRSLLTILVIPEIIQLVARTASDADTFHAIADARRREIVDLLRDGERPVSFLVAGTGISYSAVSQHLSILLRTGLATRRASGTQRLYGLNAQPLEEVYDWCAQYRLFWTARLKRLKEYLDKRS